MIQVLAVSLVAGCSKAKPPEPSWQPTLVEPAAQMSVRPVMPVPEARVGDAKPRLTPVAYTPPGSVPRVGGVYKVGKPYSINGVMYVPAEDPGYDRVGLASWYGPDFHAKQTANGEVFDMGRITAAHPTLPMPSYVHVTNLRNGRTLLVRVNDRGPYKPGRIIDLSKQTATLLGFVGQGTTQIRVRYAGPAPLDPNDDRRERAHLAAQPWHRTVSIGQRPWYGLGGPAD